MPQAGNSNLNINKTGIQWDVSLCKPRVQFQTADAGLEEASPINLEINPRKRNI